MQLRIKMNLLLIGLSLVLVNCTNETSTEAPTEEKVEAEYDESIKLPAGFKASVVVDSLGRGRHLAVKENGDIYVQLSRLNGERGTVALRDTNGDVKADLIEYFGDFKGTGIEIFNNYLYASSDLEVFRFPFQGDNLVPDLDQGEMIAGGMPEQKQHASKSFAIDPSGNLYVNIGAPSNACMEQMRTKGSPGLDPCPQLLRQAGIWKFDANKPNQQQEADATRYATGIRNAVAIGWNTMTNSLFAVQHGRDQLSGFFPDMYNDTLNAELPAEELLAVNEGDDFGWPFCYYDQFQSKKVLAPEYGGDGRAAGKCENAKDPLYAFPGHMGPNDIAFYQNGQFPDKYNEGVFIAFHGSWNRAPLRQKGYFIAFVPMKDGQPTGDWEIFADGFSGLDTDEGQREIQYRPTGIAIGPDGALYISDSIKGKIWKITYEG